VTVALYAEAPEDIEDLVLAWLLPLAGSPTGLGAERPDGAPPLFRMVTGLVTTPDSNLFYADALVSVHTFDKTRALAKRAAKDTQRRMDELTINSLTDVVMADGRHANVDYVDTVERPHYEPYGVDTIKRYVSRYRIGLAFVAVA
jgi:hypothetical protein